MTEDALFEVLEATWPPARVFQKGGWTFREGLGGGKRVSATSGSGDLAVAEAEMLGMGQDLLFTLQGDTKLDPILAEKGYEVVDPTNIYHCSIDALAVDEVPPVTAFEIWPPLQLARDIWTDGGIGPDRVAVMERAADPKTTILGRVNDRAGGAAFVAVHKGCAMIHALEILPDQRRYGLATSVITAAAHWGARQGATEFALAVTKANEGANALYRRLGMSVAAQYHYRIKRDAKAEM